MWPGCSSAAKASKISSLHLSLAFALLRRALLTLLASKWELMSLGVLLPSSSDVLEKVCIWAGYIEIELVAGGDRHVPENTSLMGTYHFYVGIAFVPTCS